MTIVLASSSRIRLQLLHNSGVACQVEKATVDEDSLKFAHGDLPAGELSALLASAKARSVSEKTRDACVIGADQILHCDGRRYDKPETVLSAKSQLLSLRGRTHFLTTSASCWRAGNKLWTVTDEASLTMRRFSDEFLERYLAEIGERTTSSVGAYKLEEKGVQLFERLEGDYFTILGLPLLPLLDFLRDIGELAT